MQAVARWTVAYAVAVLVGMIVAEVTAWGLLHVEHPFALKSLIAFGLETAMAGGIALLPTVIMYNVAVLKGWTKWWSFCLAGAAIPMIGAAVVMLLVGNPWGIPAGVVYSMVFVPSGAIAALAFRQVLGPIDVWI